MNNNNPSSQLRQYILNNLHNSLMSLYTQNLQRRSLINHPHPHMYPQIQNMYPHIQNTSPYMQNVFNPPMYPLQPNYQYPLPLPQHAYNYPLMYNQPPTYYPSSIPPQNRNNILNNLNTSINTPTNTPTIDLLLFDDGHLEVANTNNMENFLEPVSINSTLNNLRDATTVELNTNTDSSPLCSICQATVNSNEIMRRVNNCNHSFHIGCIDQWFENNVICPVCRYDIRNTNNETISPPTTNPITTPVVNTNTTPQQPTPGNINFNQIFRQLLNNANNVNNVNNNDLNIIDNDEQINNEEQLNMENILPYTRSPNSTQLMNLIDRYRNRQNNERNNERNNEQKK